MTSISTSAFLHFTWQIGHYTLQQVISDDFNTMRNSLLYIRDTGKMSHKLLEAPQEKIAKGKQRDQFTSLQ